MMKLRLRCLQYEETRKLEVPLHYSIQQLKSFLSYSLFYTPTFASSLRLSLNGKDELSSPSPDDSLLSIGITSGHLIYYYVYSPSPRQQGKPQIEQEKREIKRLSEQDLLKRALTEVLGNDISDAKLIFLAIHAVFLETGFIGFDSMSGSPVGLFDILKKQASMTFTKSVSYTLPKLVSGDNDTESVVLKFQTLGHYVNIYGCLAKSHGYYSAGVHKLKIDKSRYVPCMTSFRLKVSLEFWKFVKEGLALPLLIDLCEKTGLDVPSSLIRLPADIKFRILELLPGQDIARVACVCKEMKYLSSNNELWKEKYKSEFGSGSAAAGAALGIFTWKVKFASSWENTKKRTATLFGVRIGDRNPFFRVPYIWNA